jgi:hypothetical protein
MKVRWQNAVFSGAYQPSNCQMNVAAFTSQQPNPIARAQGALGQAAEKAKQTAAQNEGPSQYSVAESVKARNVAMVRTLGQHLDAKA